MIELPILDPASVAAKPASPSEETGAASAAPRHRFWRSIEHLKQDPEFERLNQHEFMPGALDPPTSTSRRQFMQLMGASMALAGLTACRRPVEKILPYSRKPEEVIPGVPLHYATSMPFRGDLKGILVTSHEGRPTKAEGNPEHPSTQGTAGLWAQASVLNLYDPDRSQVVLREGEESSWTDFVNWVAQFRIGAERKRVAVLSEVTTSPTVRALRAQLAETFPQLTWATYRPDGPDNEADGLRQAFGQSVRTVYRFSEAEVIVSFDADFLGAVNPIHASNAREYADSRRVLQPGDPMSRLYVAESYYTVTGGMADHRIRLRSSDIPAFAAAVARRLGVEPIGATTSFDTDPRVLAIADDLLDAESRGVVLAGEAQPPEVHALCAAINARLGAYGTTVELLGAPDVEPATPMRDLLELMRSMRQGEFDAFILLGVNPVYDAPVDLDVAGAMGAVPETIHLGPHVDETAREARWHLPLAHYLEAWGDGRAYDGTLSVIQPLIAPLYEDAHSAAEVLSLLATGIDSAGYDIVRSVWRGEVDGPFEKGWRRVLHDGFLPETRYANAQVTGPVQVPAFDNARLTGLAQDDLEVVFRLSDTVFDGSYTNNAWCLELPDPANKIVWDNVAVFSPNTAEALGVTVEYRTGTHYVSMIDLRVNGQTVQMPAWILPGHADNSVTVHLGFGRDISSVREIRKAIFFDTDHKTDIYGQGAISSEVGVNVGPLRSLDGPRIATEVSVVPTGETYEIVTTQDHGFMGPGPSESEARPLARFATISEYEAQPDIFPAMEPTLPGGEAWEDYPTLWQDDHPSQTDALKDNPYYKNQWAMTVDLNVCSGCNACVVACQAENNIMVIGKEEVGKGREMHWLRIDRYFVTEGESQDLSDPKMVVQPLSCVHCENAPCEAVCPVAATVHSPDGTNQMIYNRCIGTRYCSNNCPYKVRRYNWFNWTKNLPVQVRMQLNPNVTTRFRGVMEKCSYCIQRIREVQQRAGLENRPIVDGEIKSACQQACPSDAIAFGDLNDPNSDVVRMKANTRRYDLLAYLNVKPRTSYLGRLSNPNPRLMEV
ncbi:MAG: TAT-variant-translocated molybdopterin oxidoreductase [Bacteroidota bacterium]